ncbi:MAG: glycosyl hydrolase 108 family protein, partial [Allosphingosinicella sp.]
MAGPFDAFPRIEVGVQPLPPPPPPTGFWENLHAGYEQNRLRDNTISESIVVTDAYKPVVEALNDGRDRGGLFLDGTPLARLTGSVDNRFYNPGGFAPGAGPEAGQRDRQASRIFEEIRRRRLLDPNFLKGVPDSQAEFERQTWERASNRSRALADVEGRATGRGRIGGFAGALGGAMTDPVNLMTLPFGGVGRAAATRVLTEGLAMGGVTAIEQPQVAEQHARLGQDYTADDFLLNVGAGALGGAAFRGLGEVGALGARAGGNQLRLAFPDWARARDAKAFGQAMDRAVRMGGFDQAELPRVAARLMDPDFGVRSDAEAKAQLRRELEAGTFDHRAVAEHFRMAVPEDRRTPDEQAALAAIERDAGTAESSPFEPGAYGEEVHRETLRASLQRILDDAPKAPDAAAEISPVTGYPRGTKAYEAKGGERPVHVVTAADTIRFVLHDLEGGDRIVHYSGADGGTTKFGIAQAANPGVDVANLTEEAAARIARRKYWLPEFDQARPDVAAVAFDAYYTHGDPRFAKRLAAMRDPGEALAAYRQLLNRIADTVPGKAKYRKGWNHRLDRLAEFVRAEEPAFASPQVRPELARGPAGEDVVAPVEDLVGDPPEFGVAPANRGSDGKIYVGDRGTTHFHVSEKYPDVEFIGDTGFVNARGQYLDRKQALDWVTAEGETIRPSETMSGQLDALDYKDQMSRLRPVAIDVRDKAPPRRSGPPDLMQAVADAGGLLDSGGHDLVAGRGIPRFVLGAGTIVRKAGDRRGRSLDQMGERLWEEGWFGPPETARRPSEDDVLQLVERAAREKVYRPEDMAAVAERSAAAGRISEDEALFHLAEAAREGGLHLDPATLDDALMRLAGGDSLEEAVGGAVHAARFRDAGLERFDDPDAEAAR